MEDWYSAVRQLKDESEDPKLTRELCFHIYHDMMFIKLNRKLKEKDKFRNRKGAEFEAWTTELEDEYSQELITHVLSYDPFWTETIKNTLG